MSSRGRSCITGCGGGGGDDDDGCGAGGDDETVVSTLRRRFRFVPGETSSLLSSLLFLRDMIDGYEVGTRGLPSGATLNAVVVVIQHSRRQRASINRFPDNMMERTGREKKGQTSNCDLVKEHFLYHYYPCECEKPIC